MPKKSYPVFLAASEWTIVPFWQEIFKACSEGRFPSGFTLSKNLIYLNRGSRCLKYELPTQPQEVLILCKTIFENELGIKDEIEKEKDINSYKKFQEQNTQTQADKEITKIKDVRKKEDKLKLIDEFVLQTGINMNLSLFQKQKLKTAILTGLDLKIIKDIEFDDSKIIKITGLVLKKDKKKLVCKLQV